jgi:phosphatidate phosphatase LPIN
MTSEILIEKTFIKEEKQIGPKFDLSNSLNEVMKNPENAAELFQKNIITKEEFAKDPWKVLNNPNLLILLNSEKLLTYKAAAPLLFSLACYGESIPDEVMQGLTYVDIPKKGFFKMFSPQQKQRLSKIQIKGGSSDPTSTINLNKEENVKQKVEIKQRRESVSKYRSPTPTSNQLFSLDLKPGRNEISFVCKSRLSGTQILKSDIYLWDDDDKIIISDIDGTITRSDVLGQIMPMIGKDWSHEGVTDLFTSFEKNGYKMLYLTARALCQSGTTKNFIQTLFQHDKGLPRGPILTSPDGLVSSFKREVIDKTPQTFKIACLMEVKNLFTGENGCPFYSGFGNRQTVIF